MKKLIWILILILGLGACAVAYNLLDGNGDNDNGDSSHIHNYDTVIPNGNNTHNKICSNDNTHVITENCNGGMATCTQKAVCEVCSVEYGDLKEHEFYDEIFVISGCNYNVNYHAKICKYCLGTFDIENGNVVVHPHSWVLAESIAPTCTQMGYNAHFKCKLCDLELLGEVVAPLGHKESGNYYDNGLNHYRFCSRTDCGVKVYGQHKYDWTVLEYPTCTTNGNKTGECSLCGHETQEDILGGHLWDDGEITLEPKCTTVGEKSCTCIICGETKKTEVNPLGHNWDIGTIIKKATCYEEGEKLYKCLRCGEEEQRNYGTEHNWKTIVVNEKTCYEDGEIYYKCIDCGLEKTEKIQAGHGDIIKEEKHATCLEWGYYKEICSICDAVIKEGYLKPLGHNLNIAYDDEFHWHKCSRCDYQENKEEHLLTLKAITETIDDGTQVLYKHGLFDVCTYDGCEYKKQYGEWKLSVHYAVEIIKSNLATCTESGFTPGLKCAVNGCGEILVEQEESLPLGHNWYRGNCQRCGETQLEMQLSTDGTYYIVKSAGSFKGENLEIPSTYKGLNVTSIGDGAFWGCESLTSVVISNGVTSIEFSAFNTCSSLTSIIIPNSVTSIGYRAFEYCRSLTSVEIPNCVMNIVEGAFAYCSSLTSIIVDESNLNYKSIDGNLYTKDGKSLIQYAIGKTVSSFSIPNSVTSIGESAFAHCSSLSSVVIPDSVTKIGYGTFSLCDSLTSVKIPNSVTSIGENAFEYCDLLTSIEIPNSVTSIGRGAFRFNSGLTSVVISNSVTSIGVDVFYNCESLISIIVDERNPNYKSIAGNLYSGDGKTLIQYAIGKTATSFSIPNSVTSINECAFAHCSSLTGIEIPNSVTSIGDDAFEFCSSLTSVVIPNSITSIGNSAFLDCTSLTSVVIGNSVTSIGWGAFAYCYSLRCIKIPNSVTNIDSSVFYDCHSLTIYCEVENEPSSWDSSWNITNCPIVWNSNNNDVADDDCIYTIVDGIRYALKNKDATVVRQAVNITSANISSIVVYKDISYRVTSIDEEAFKDCNLLTSVKIPNSITSIGYSAFEYCYILTIYCETENEPSSWDSEWNISNCPVVWKCKNNDVADDGYIYTIIDGIRYALKNKQATVVRQPENITTADIKSMVEYKGENYSITSIEGDAFWCCDLITSIIIPNTVTKIGYRAFWSCDSLTSIIIPNSVTSIGGGAFANSSSLTSIVIPESVTSIGYSTFENCSSLTSITFSDTSTWYMTNNYANWQNKTGGIEINLKNPTTNATYFKDTYDNYYWYKL